jgi:hypothetical protein
MPYYSVTVSNRSGHRAGGETRGSLCWSAAFDHGKDAAHHGRALLRTGDATLSLVVEVRDDGTRRVLWEWTRPGPARTVIQHCLELLAQLRGDA